MKEELINLIEEKSPGARPLYLVIRGSHAYGTNIETSDTDYAGVFIQSKNDILGNSYKEQINDDNNDIVIYEVRRFLELLGSNNPTVLELLNTPEDCVIYKDPVFDMVLENRDKFITKICAKSFGGYAKQQISKAKGQDKKQNWEKGRVSRKTPLDFCYIYDRTKAVPLTEFLKSRGTKQEDCGISKIPHCKDLYALYHDRTLKREGRFKGIAFEESNELRLSSVPKELEYSFVGYVSYNKDGYSQHCRDYKSYQTWLEERNEARWVDVESHGQKIDGKNMMHCKRLMEMAKEIGEGKGIIVRRPNAQYLISIRKGEVDLQTLIDSVEEEIKEVDRIFEESVLPDKIDENFINNLIINIRKQIYNL
jgi:hypothetical protein